MHWIVVRVRDAAFVEKTGDGVVGLSLRDLRIIGAEGADAGREAI